MALSGFFVAEIIHADADAQDHGLIAVAASRGGGLPSVSYLAKCDADRFGAGSAKAKFLLIGEQAGDQEDRVGQPFVGPVGKLLDQALEDAGLERADFYITNVVKHFKFEERGKRRLHKRANAAEIEVCSQWLQGEFRAVKTPYLICLGALATQIVMGRHVKLQGQRGQWTRLEGERWALATVHPSFVIRSRIGGGFDEAYAGFVADMKKIRQLPK